MLDFFDKNLVWKQRTLDIGEELVIIKSEQQGVA
jgi:hypothetical protein